MTLFNKGNIKTLIHEFLSHFAIIFEVVVFQLVHVTQIIVISFDGNQFITDANTALIQ